MSLGANSKLIAALSERKHIQTFYRDVLGCVVDITPEADLVWLRSDFYLGVVYDGSSLSDAELLNAISLELRTDHLEATILKYGINELEYRDGGHSIFRPQGAKSFG